MEPRKYNFYSPSTGKIQGNTMVDLDDYNFVVYQRDRLRRSNQVQKWILFINMMMWVVALLLYLIQKFYFPR